MNVFRTRFAVAALILSGLQAGVSLMALAILGTADPVVQVTGLSGMARFVMQNLAVYVGVNLACGIVGVLASIGLLRGKRWARETWSLLLVLIVGWCMACVSVEALSLIGGHSRDPDLMSSFQRQASPVVIPLGLIGIGSLGWLLLRIRRLCPE